MEGSVRPYGPKVMGVMTLDFMTLLAAELKRTNTVTVVMDITGEMMELSSIGFEWK